MAVFHQARVREFGLRPLKLAGIKTQSFHDGYGRMETPAVLVGNDSQEQIQAQRLVAEAMQKMPMPQLMVNDAVTFGRSHGERSARSEAVWLSRLVSRDKTCP